MHTDTTDLIDETIMRLQTLQEVFAEDFDLCRRSGLSQDARKCGDALEAITLLLPRLQTARSTQDPAGLEWWPGYCASCE